MVNAFKHVEDEYLRLRGLLAISRITREQYDAALRELMFKDEQGHYWMLGAETGKWHMYDGKHWVLASPPTSTLGRDLETKASAPPQPSQPIPLPASPPAFVPQPTVPVYLEDEARWPSRILILALIGILLACIVVAGVYAYLLSQGTPQVALSTAATRTVTPAPLYSPTSSTTLTAAETASPTPISTATQTPTSISTAVSTPTPVPTPVAQPTVRVATAAPSPTLAKPTPNVPPGIYVTAIRTDPPEVKNGQLPTFQVDFLNTLGGTVYYRWYVKIFDPDKKQSFGETAKMDAELVAGTSTLYSAANWKGVGTTPCRQFVARVFYEAPDKTVLEFPKVSGDNFYYDFSVCQ